MSDTVKKPDYGNWVPNTLMYFLWGAAAVFLLLALFLHRHTAVCILFVILFLIFGAAAWYMQVCRKVLSFEGGGLMRKIHEHILTRLEWDGKGTLLDVGCGAGALSILAAKKYPEATVTGMDYWGREWNFAKEQCESNAELEGVSNTVFQQGDAAKLPFADGSFDAVVSNFVYHEVRTEPNKRKLILETLRVLKKGGAFALHDMFSTPRTYGDMNEFVEYLKAEGISEVYYEANTENLSFIPSVVRSPLMLKGTGMIYGIK